MADKAGTVCTRLSQPAVPVFMYIQFQRKIRVWHTVGEINKRRKVTAGVVGILQLSAEQNAIIVTKSALVACGLSLLKFDEIKLAERRFY